MEPNLDHDQDPDHNHHIIINQDHHILKQNIQIINLNIIKINHHIIHIKNLNIIIITNHHIENINHHITDHDHIADHIDIPHQDHDPITNIPKHKENIHLTNQENTVNHLITNEIDIAITLPDIKIIITTTDNDRKADTIITFGKDSNHQENATNAVAANTHKKDVELAKAE